MKERGTKRRLDVCARVLPSHSHSPLFGGCRSVDGSDVGEWVGLGGGWIRVIAP